MFTEKEFSFMESASPREQKEQAGTEQKEKGKRTMEDKQKEKNIQQTELILENIGGLPSEYMRAEYSRFEPLDYKDFIEQKKKEEGDISPEFIDKMKPLITESEEESWQEKSYSPRDLSVVIKSFFNQKENSGRYEQIEETRAWLKSQEPDKETQFNLEAELAGLLKEQEKLDSYDLLLLGELEQYNNGNFVSEKIVKVIEDKFSSFESLPLMDEMAVLNRANTDRSNLAMNKILDYLSAHLKTLQNQPPHKELDNKFFVDFYNNFLEEEKDLSANYIVKKNMQNLSETFDVPKTKKYKKDIISGTSGGTGDREIYVYSHQLESYYNKLGMGIKEGYVAGKPVFQITPGYYGQYKGGNLGKIYTCETDDPEHEAKKIEQTYIDQTNDGDEYIYDEINSPFSFDATRYSDDSYKLRKLDNIWNFEEEKGDNFFYDISKVDIDSLHPIVLTHLLTENYKYALKKEGLEENNHKQVNKEEFYHRLQPLGEYSEDEFYEYKQLSKLNIRKALQDDFGINIEECDLWTQRNFLEYLKTRDVEEAEELREFTGRYGERGLKTFVSLESGEEMGDTILNLGKELEDAPQVADSLFSKHAEIVDSMDTIADEAAEMYEEVFYEKQVDKDQVKQNLLMKANNLLQTAHKELNDENNEVDKTEIVDELIRDLKREEKTNQQAIANLKDLAEKVRGSMGKLENILPLQQNLENQLDQFVYGITDLEKEDQNIADRVFSRYRELVNQAQKSKQEISEMFKDDTQVSDQEIEKISENILDKAKSLLEDFSQKMINEQEVNEEEIAEKLNSYKSDMVFTASVMATLKKEFGRADVDVEDIKGVTFEQKTVSELNDNGELGGDIEKVFEDKNGSLSPEVSASSLENYFKDNPALAEDKDAEQKLEEIREMMNIYRENYEHSPELQAKLLKGFAELVKGNKGDTTLYTLKQNEEIMAFCRFTDLGEGKKEFGAFNVPESLHGSAIGSSFLRSTLEKEARNNDIYAECDSDSLISSYYINGNKGKFVATEVISDYAETGNTILSICRPDQKKEQRREYKYHQFSPKEIIQEYEYNFGENQLDNNDPLLLKFEKGSEEFKNICSSLVNEQGYVITNYVIDEENKATYVALEKQ
jgi:hypothetical protein